LTKFTIKNIPNVIDNIHIVNYFQYCLGVPIEGTFYIDRTSRITTVTIAEENAQKVPSENVMILRNEITIAKCNRDRGKDKPRQIEKTSPKPGEKKRPDKRPTKPGDKKNVQDNNNHKQR